MKQPKRLFKRDRVSHDHETVTVSTDDLLPIGGAFDPARHIVHVPVARFVELDCDHCLRGLEALGVRVDRSKGSSAIDIARNIRATEAVTEGYDSVLFIDSDMLFDPADAITLLRSPEPVIAGAYAAKKLGNGQLNADFEDGVTSVRFGDWADRLYPVKAVGAGFLRIKTAALKQIARTLELPWCRMAERFAWPFFQPMILRQDDGNFYLGEDYSFIHRCRQAGLVPKVDTSFRVYHIGDYAYGLEEAAGQYLERGRNIDYQIRRSVPRSAAEAVPPSWD
jgi:hypothetical protein